MATAAKTRRPRRTRTARDAEGRDARRHRRDDERDLGENVGSAEGAVHNVTNDVNALVQAWSDANAEVVKGLASVVSSLVLDLNESIGAPVRARRRRSADEIDDDEDYEDEEEISGGLSRVSRSLSDAISETANVFQRSGDRFQQRYSAVGRGAEDTDEDRAAPHMEGTEHAQAAREKERRDTKQTPGGSAG